MMAFSSHFAMFLFRICFLIGHCLGQNSDLTAVVVKNMPESVYLGSPFYDGGDFIYLFGGARSNTPSKKVTRFSISTTELSDVSFMPAEGSGGIVFADSSSENLYYFSGNSNPTQVYKYNIASYVTQQLSTMPYNFPYHFVAASQSNNTYCYGTGNTPRNILRFDWNTLQTTVAGTVPISIGDGTSENVNGQAYIFSKYLPAPAEEFQSVLKVDLNNFGSESGPKNFPRMAYSPNSVYDGSHIYIIGGYRPDTTSVPTSGIIKFTPGTFEWSFLPVANFPVSGENLFYNSPDAVYVEKLNRIYMFGGISYNAGAFRYHDEIWSIDLGAGNPPTTQRTTTTTDATITSTQSTLCSGRPDGIYPYPSDCSMFIICSVGNTQIFKCDPPLLFDPVAKSCDRPENVNCESELTCNGKPDGRYPHPTDCSLFLICFEGELDVFSCPSPLLFDPVEKRCNLPNLVDCSGKK